MSEASLLRLSRTASLLAVAGGTAVLLGWAAGTEALYQPTPNAPVITPWTAFCCASLGLAIFGRSWRTAWWGGVLMVLGGSLVMVVAGLSAGEYAFGDLRGFDTLLFSAQVSLLPMNHPGRPSIQALAALLALACVAWTGVFQNKAAYPERWIEAFVLFSGTIALLALFGYAFSVPVLFASPTLRGTGLSPYSAILVLWCSVALVLMEPRSFIRSFVGSPGPGGRLVRSLLPVFILMPLLFGLLRTEGERRGWVSHETGIALMAMGQFFLGVGMLFWVARNLDRVEALKKIIKMTCVSKKVFHQGEWVTVEEYLREHHNIEVSHGMTPDEAETWLREAMESIAVEKS